jgi:hypothetical protein
LICIAGGYGAGWELVQFFLLYGPVGGLLGRGWFIYEIAYLFSIVLILAVIGSARDQRRRLEGRDWPRKGTGYTYL